MLEDCDLAIDVAMIAANDDAFALMEARGDFWKLEYAVV
jgi:hypothetical protein